MAFETVKKNLEARGFSVQTFATAAEAAEYLNGAIDGVSVGIGGSITIQEMGLHDRLASHNTVYWHWTDGAEVLSKAMTAQVYLTSVNGLAETGEILNIDGNGNRVASMLYGHRKVYLVAGRNKLARRSALAGPEHCRAEKCPAAGQEDALRREGGPVL